MHSKQPNVPLIVAASVIGLVVLIFGIAAIIIIKKRKLCNFKRRRITTPEISNLAMPPPTSD